MTCQPRLPSKVFWVAKPRVLAGIILWMRPANERRRYIVTSSLIGWAHTQNDPCAWLWRFIFLQLWSSGMPGIVSLRKESSNIKYCGKYKSYIHPIQSMIIKFPHGIFVLFVILAIKLVSISVEGNQSAMFSFSSWWPIPCRSWDAYWFISHNSGTWTVLVACSIVYQRRYQRLPCLAGTGHEVLTSHYWPFVRGIHRAMVDSPIKGKPRFDLFVVVVMMNKFLNKGLSCWWFEMSWCSCDITVRLMENTAKPLM